MAELMKGKKWHERKHLVKYPVLVEVKHDEIRCHVLVTQGRAEFVSYAGKPLANMQVFAEHFRSIADATGLHEFDCGFEVNSNFNDSYRWVRSTRGLPDDLQGAPTRFYLFDLPEDTTPYIVRRARICDVAGKHGLFVPEGRIACSEAEVDTIFSEYREAGFEGAMIKTSEHTYQRGKRIDGWLKMKPEDDGDGKIVGFNEAVSLDGTPLGRIGSVDLDVDDGSRVSPHGIAFALGYDMFQNPAKYLGRWVEFKYMERDRQGGYRHPTFSRLREDK